MRTITVNRKSWFTKFLIDIDVIEYGIQNTICSVTSRFIRFIGCAILGLIVFAVFLAPFSHLIACIIASTKMGYWIGLNHEAFLGLMGWLAVVVIIAAFIGNNEYQSYRLLHWKDGAEKKPWLIVEMWRSFRDKTCVKIEIEQ